MNIALIGFRGTGKTTIAELLARRLDKKLISTNDELVKKTNLSIEKLMKRYNPEQFRDIETNIIEAISDFDDCIFDTGGGMVMRNENIINLKKNALIILLTADIKSIKSRLKNTHINEIKDIVQEVEERYKKAADYTIDTSILTPEEICDLIIHYVQMELK